MPSALGSLVVLTCAHLHFTHATTMSTVAFAGHNAARDLDHSEPTDTYNIPAGECKTHFGPDKVGCYYPHTGKYLDLHQLKVDVRDQNQVDIKISEPDINEVWIERDYCDTPVEVRLTKACLLGGGYNPGPYTKQIGAQYYNFYEYE